MRSARLPTQSATNNKMLDGDRGIHSWYRFVLSFPPHLVRTYLQRFRLGRPHTVLDPFCGTGTTVVECKKLGVRAVGVEAHPMSHFAASTKVNWAPSGGCLLKHATKVAAAATAELQREGLAETGISAQQAVLSGKRNLRTLPPDEMKLLLKNSMSPLPLHRTLVLLEHIRNAPGRKFKDHELLAFARIIVSSVSNLHFGPEVGVRSPKTDAPVVTPWLAEVRAMADDLSNMGTLGDSSASVLLGDARALDELLEPESVDAVITSPPYPNEKDYSRTTRLESVLLGFIKDRGDLQAVKRGLVRSNTRGVYKGDDDDDWIAGHSKIKRIARAIEARRIEMGKDSGFERMYHRVTTLYFGGMAKHLASMRSALRPGAQLAYVVGDQASYLRIMIRTGQLLAQIAQSLGYELVDIDLFRTRMATATKQRLREEVVILRWPG